MTAAVSVIGMTPNLPSADRPGGAGCEEGPGGGPAAALSLLQGPGLPLCPPCTVSARQVWQGGVSHSHGGWLPEAAPFQNFVGDKTVGNLEFSALWDSRGLV